MKKLSDKLDLLSQNMNAGAPLKIAIFGIGSVAGYLLDYLTTWSEPNVQIHVCGRSPEKVEAEINIVRVANLIRYNTTKRIVFHKVDLNDIDEIASVLEKVAPDFIVNCSRVYSGLKYGSISWKSFRAYGLWCPLSVKFIRNIMIAYKRVQCIGIVINTSYSDAVNQWIKSAGLSYPDFGSGNLNHLIPRMKLAAAAMVDGIGVNGVEVVLATSHFHDVVISKEGHTEGVDPLIHLSYQGKSLKIDLKEMYKRCAIAMPIDSKRNMMNASSNFEIICKIVNALRMRSTQIIHSPGVAGYIGGYPIRIDFRGEAMSERRVSFVEDYFSLREMEAHNRASIALDGIEDISEGTLTYTAALCEKVKKSFGVVIPKTVAFGAIEDMTELLIEKIIRPSLMKVP